MSQASYETFFFSPLPGPPHKVLQYDNYRIAMRIDHLRNLIMIMVHDQKNMKLSHLSV